MGKDGQVDLHQGLNQKQVKNILEACGVKAKDAVSMFEAMDTDGSGAVDYVEVVAFFCSTAAGTLAEKGSLFFHACDIDGSKSISKGELKDVVLRMMMLRRDSQGVDSFLEKDKVLYAGIPETMILTLKANEIVADVFANASKDGENCYEKGFETWLMRGGKTQNRLNVLFGL